MGDLPEHVHRPHSVEPPALVSSSRLLCVHENYAANYIVLVECWRGRIMPLAITTIMLPYDRDGTTTLLAMNILP